MFWENGCSKFLHSNLYLIFFENAEDLWLSNWTGKKMQFCTFLRPCFHTNWKLNFRKITYFYLIFGITNFGKSSNNLFASISTCPFAFVKIQCQKPPAMLCSKTAQQLEQHLIFLSLHSNHSHDHDNFSKSKGHVEMLTNIGYLKICKT